GQAGRVGCDSRLPASSCAANVSNRAARRKRFRCRGSRKCTRGFLTGGAQGYIDWRVKEGWPSGLRRTLGKRVYGKPYRGFESHSLRQGYVRGRPPTSNNARKNRRFHCTKRLRASVVVCHNSTTKRWYRRWSAIRFRDRNVANAAPVKATWGEGCEAD